MRAATRVAWLCDNNLRRGDVSGVSDLMQQYKSCTTRHFAQFFLDLWAPQPSTLNPLFLGPVAAEGIKTLAFS